MSRSVSEWSTDLRELLAQERQILALPPATRERALVRAREALASMAATPAAEPGPRRIFRWVTVAAVLGLASAAGGLTAYELSSYARPSATTAVVTARIPHPELDRQASDTPVTEPGRTAPTSSSTSRQTGRLALEEMRLLEEARSALDGEDFAAAMVPLVEHARRFKNGQLTEEREALRVKALSGLGLRDEVRRAAAEFEARFPRSPLLPAVSRIASSS